MVFALSLIVAGSACAFENAPLATREEVVPLMTPFRVWVLPGTGGGGVARDGFYEFFELSIEHGTVTVLEAPSTAPAIEYVTARPE